MPISVERFLESAAAHGLLGADEAAALASALPAEKRSQDADELARQLVRDGKLTRFQAAAIYQEKADGLVLGNYVILDRLGAGGMGQVFRARHRRMDRVVALKVLSKKLLGSPDALQRFHRETKAAARLSHPNIVTAHDADEAGGMHFLVMEYVEGSDLGELVKKGGPLPPAQAVDLVLQAARGLEHAHAQGIVHRDIKPSNLLVDLHGTLKILDMGLARFHDPLASPDAAADKDLTQTGSIMGTIDYMAPEQAMDSRQANAQSDFYSLGCTLYFLLAGRPPFGGDTMLKRLTAHQQAAIPLLSAARPDVSPALEAVCQRLLTKRPAGRYASAAELIQALEGCLASPESTAQQAAGQKAATGQQPPSVGYAPVPIAIPLSRPPATSSLGEMTSVILPGDSSRRRAAPRSRSGWKLPAAGVLLLLAAPVSYWFLSQRDDAALPQVAEAAEQPATTPDAVPTSADIVAAASSAARGEPPQTPVAASPPAEEPAPPVKTMPPTAAVVATPAASVPATSVPPVQPAAAIAPPASPPAAADTPASAPDAPVAAADDRLPVPDEAQQEQSQQLLKDVFKADFANTKQPEAKQALAEKLLKQAEATQGDAASSYAMLHTAADLAIEVPDLPLVQRAIGALALRFRIDPFEETAEAMDRMLARPHPQETNKLLATAALERAEEAAGERRYDLARRLAELAVAAARKSKDATLVRQAVDRNKNLTATRQLWEAKEKAMAALASDPDDPAANLTVGKYLCFAEDNWDAGLPHLAKGSDTVLKELAVESLQPSADPPAQAALADKWWQAAEKSKGKGKPDLQAGAVHWYALAAPGLSGLAKVKVEQRLKSAGVGAGPGSQIAGSLSTGGKSAGRTLSRSQLPANGKLPAALDLVLAPGVGIKFRLIPAGTFTMGTPAGNGPETAHQVNITRPFYFGVTEVTKAQWLSMMGERSNLTEGGPNHPAAHVSWNDCQQFIDRLNQTISGRKFHCRLPTEAEWEYACRAGTTTKFSFGDDVALLPQYGWFVGNSDGKLQPVAQLPPNAWGLYDMHGGVWEWCSDWFFGDYYKKSPRDDPPGPTTGARRVLRGGSFRNLADACRSAERNGISPDVQGDNYGLRIVCEPVATVAGASVVVTPPRVAADAPAGARHRPLAFAQAETERRAASWVLSAGGKVKIVTPAAMVPDPAEITAASGLPAEPFMLFSVDLGMNKSVTDGDLAKMAGLADLKELKLNGTSIGDAGLAHLDGLVHLQILYLHLTQVTDAGLKHLAGMHEMKGIYFSSAHAVSDAGLTLLDGMPELRALSVGNTRATDATLARIGRLRQLGWLSLSGCSITDRGLESLLPLEKLVSLEVNNCPITDAGVATLARLPMLANILLQTTTVTDRSLELLAGQPLLKMIDVTHTKVTEAGIKGLLLAKPHCEIKH